MIPVSLLITVIKKYAGNALMVALAAAVIFGMYLHWKSEIYDQGYNDAVLKYQKETQRLLDKKNKEVDEINKQNAERSYNAAKTYADHASNFQRDVDNLTKRMSNSAGGGRNAVCRQSDNTREREAENPEPDRRIAQATIDLVNSCEMWLNQIPVK